MTILGPLLTILTLLLPFLIQRLDARKAAQPREKIDELLVTGSPLDVGAALSELYEDATRDSPRQSATDVPRVQ